MAQQKIKFPALTDAIRSRKMIDMLKFFGPGAIMASLTIGSGETFFASRGGAIFGYAILWAFTLGTIMKGIATYTAMRYITLTGEHPMDRWAHFPGPKGWFPFLIGALSIACFPFWLSFLPSLLGTLTNWMFGFGDHRVWGTFFIALAIALTIMGGYDVLEKAQTIIVALLIISILFSVFYFQPDWLAVLKGSFIPSLPDYAPWIFQKYPEVASRPVWVEAIVYVGAIGGGTYDYIGYVGLLREKDWGVLGLPNLQEVQQRVYELTGKGERIPLSEEPEDVETGLAWLKAPIIDVTISFASVVIFAAGFMIGGARILHTDQLIPSGLKLLEYQARFLTDIHKWLLPIYDAGVFLAIFGTVYGAYEVYTRTAYECMRTVFKGLRHIPVEKVRPWVLAYVGVVGLFIMWLPKLFPNIKLIDIPTPAGIIGGVFTLGLWSLAMLWTDRTYLPKPYQMGPVLFTLNLISGIAMTAMGLKAWWDYGVDTFGANGGWKGYGFLLFMVILSMIIVALINRYYRRKEALAS